jgi:type II secretory pathway component HofQ
MKTMTALLLCCAAALAGDSRDEVARKLEAKVSLDLKGAKLGDAIQIFRDVTGLNFVVEDGSELFVRLTVRDVTAKSALRLLLQPADLGAGYEHGAVVIRDRQALATTTTFRLYDVRGALRKVQDFPGPRIELRPLRLPGVI